METKEQNVETKERFEKTEDSFKKRFEERCKQHYYHQLKPTTSDGKIKF